MLITAEICPVKIQVLHSWRRRSAHRERYLWNHLQELFIRKREKNSKSGKHYQIMTLLRIFEALEDRQITLEEEAVTSAMQKVWGSPGFSGRGEKQTVETLIKCIVVASGNDASVVMAEHLAEVRNLSKE